MERCYFCLALHVYHFRIVMRIPLLSCFSHTFRWPASAAPRHHFDLPIETPTHFPPLLLQQSILSLLHVLTGFFFVYLHLPRSFPLPLSHIRSIFLPSYVSSFWYSWPIIHHYCNALATILASLSSVSFPFPSSFDKVFSKFCSVVSFTLPSLFSYIPLPST